MQSGPRSTLEIIGKGLPLDKVIRKIASFVSQQATLDNVTYWATLAFVVERKLKVHLQQMYLEQKL